MSEKKKTTSVNGHMVAAKCGDKYRAAVAWNDPAIYPADGQGVQANVYAPMDSMKEAVATAIGIWCADMALAGVDAPMLYIDSDATDRRVHDNVGPAHVIYGITSDSPADPVCIRRQAAMDALSDPKQRPVMCADGTVVGSPMAAVRKFMCPGPCSPDCPLYKAVQTDAGWVLSCHPSSVCEDPDRVLGLIGARFMSEGCPTPEELCGVDQEPGRYVALVASGAVRDVQVASRYDAELIDDDAWHDCRDAEVFLDIYEGTEAQCRAKAAEYARTDPRNIRLIRL